jgi:site-specific recombinase XerD
MTDANELLFRGLARQLKRLGRSPQTTVAYHAACQSLEDYLTASGAPTADLLAVTADVVTDWMIELREHGGWHMRDGALWQRGTPLAKDSVVSYFAQARRFYNWAEGEGLIDASPVKGMAAPPGSGKPVPIPDIALVQAMIATTSPGRKGSRREPLDVRDELIIRLFCETGGPRCSEVAYLPAEALDLRRDTVRIHGKGDKYRVIALSASTAAAAQRWMTLRARHPGAALPWLLLGSRGQLGSGGVYKVIRRRAALAGGQVYPHQLRHLAADRAKTAEMSDGDIMTLFGWSSPQMLTRYGKARAEARAIEASRRHALGDQL